MSASNTNELGLTGTATAGRDAIAGVAFGALSGGSAPNVFDANTPVLTWVAVPFANSSAPVKHASVLRVSDQMDEQDGATSVTLGGITSVDSLTVFRCGRLATFAPASLLYIGTGGLTITMCPSLATISLPSLVSSNGNVTIGGSGANCCAALTTVSFPALVVAAGISVQFNWAMTTFSAPALRAVGAFNLVNLPLLTSIDLSSLVSATYVYLAQAWAATSLSLPAFRRGAIRLNGGNANLTTFSAPLWDSALSETYEGMEFSSMTGLTSVNVSSLRKVTKIDVSSCTALPALSFPALTTVSASASYKNPSTPGTFAVTGNTLLASLTAPLLSEVGSSFTVSGSNQLTALSLPQLATLGALTGTAFTVSSCSTLDSVSMPALVSAAGAIVLTTGLGSLTSVTLGAVGTTKSINGNVTITGQKLTEASVDAILAVLASLDGTGGTTAWGAGKTVALTGGTSAAPSAAGLVSKGVIVARGGTVTHN